KHLGQPDDEAAARSRHHWHPPNPPNWQPLIRPQNVVGVAEIIAYPWRTRATTHGRYRPGSVTRTFSTPCATPSCRRIGSRISGADRSAFEPSNLTPRGGGGRLEQRIFWRPLRYKMPLCRSSPQLRCKPAQQATFQISRGQTLYTPRPSIADTDRPRFLLKWQPHFETCKPSYGVRRQ